MYRSSFATSTPTPPDMSSPAANNLYDMDGFDDGGLSFGDAANPTFDPNDFLNADLMGSPMQTAAQLNFGSPAAAQLTFGSPAMFQSKNSPLPQFQQPRSAVSSASPESSTQDSSSDSSGRRKRKSPSTSSPAAIFGFPAYAMQHENGLQMPGSKRQAKVDSPLLNQEDATMGMLNNSMTQNFNLKTVGNSPTALGKMHAWSGVTPRSLNKEEYGMMPLRTRSPATFQFGAGSRDNTPPSAVSFESAHNTPYMMMRDSPDADGMNFIPARTPYGAGPVTDGYSMFSTAPPIQTHTNLGTIRPIDIGRQQISFHVSPLGHKSRVETQIPIKLTLDRLPPGVRRMHLPTETIAKAKFLAKEIQRAPDTLELSAMLVCTSAMEKPDNRAHAFQIAAEGSHLRRGKNPRRSSTGDTKKATEFDASDPDSPINGGPVRICDNCVSRERKRAGRKKAKKQEDEERWQEHEQDRIIMFNTQEYLDFHPPTPTKEPQYAENVVFSPEAMQVDAPMRIVCYCRHQQEKIGFQVIFTVKDWQGRVIAQRITDSILITDDHKTHTHTHTHTASQSSVNLTDHRQYRTPSFNSGSAVQGHGLPGRAYNSSTNLASAGGQEYFNNLAQPTPIGPRASTSMTPRNMSRPASRPASPTGQVGPKKKRKPSGSMHKIPADLIMTRSDMESVSQPPTSAPHGPPLPSLASPEASRFSLDGNMSFAPSANNFNPPPTPDASVKLADGTNYFFSAPNSAHASRAPSPSSFARQSMAMFNQQPAASTTTFNNAQLGQSEPQQPLPTIYKVRPERGPVSGNIEVVILGKNFSRNLEVMFGENKATTTTFWNADTLVCLLPPTAVARPVPVTFISTGRQVSPPAMGSPIFTYIDDTKQQLFELAIQLQCAAQLGPGADHFQFAQTILSSANTSPVAGFSAGPGSGFGGNMLSNVNNVNTEDLILAIINKIDLIDSAYTPLYDSKREGGVTMLSLACSLGYDRLVAGLLARGADPDITDAGGYTPLMLAAFHGHTAVARRLILRGADPTIRNLQGMTADDLATSSEVRHFVRHRRHNRSASAGTPFMHSRANSIASTRSLWGPPSSSASSTMYTTEDETAFETSDDEEEEVGNAPPIPSCSLASRRSSMTLLQSRRSSDLPRPTSAHGETALASTIASFAALRDQLTAQINALQESMPSMQVSELLQDQNLQALGRKFSSLVPMRRDTPTPDAGPSSVRDRAPTPAADPPPPYHEACPDGVNNDFDTKPPELTTRVAVASSSRAPVLRSRQPAAAVIQTTTNSGLGIASLTRGNGKVTIGKTSPTCEEAAELRRMRMARLTPVRQDRNLWALWFPLLIITLVWYSSGFSLPSLFPFSSSSSSTSGRPNDAPLSTNPSNLGNSEKMTAAAAAGISGEGAVFLGALGRGVLRWIGWR